MNIPELTHSGSIVFILPEDERENGERTIRIECDLAIVNAGVWWNDMGETTVYFTPWHNIDEVEVNP